MVDGWDRTIGPCRVKAVPLMLNSFCLTTHDSDEKEREPVSATEGFGVSLRDSGPNTRPPAVPIEKDCRSVSAAKPLELRCGIRALPPPDKSPTSLNLPKLGRHIPKMGKGFASFVLKCDHWQDLANSFSNRLHLFSI